MRQLLVPLMALLALASAKPEFSTLRFMYFAGGIDPFDASAAITFVSGPTTVAYINCPLSQETYDCPYGSGMNYTIVSSTSFEWTVSQSNLFTMTLDCTDSDGKSPILNCGMYAWDGEVPTETISTSTLLPRTGFTYIEATVTKGSELLNGGSAAPSSTGSASTAKPSEPGGGADASSGTTTPSATPQSSGTSAQPPQSTGAAYRYGVEAPLLAVAGGLAAFFA